jgi:hypothetical protein
LKNCPIDGAVIRRSNAATGNPQYCRYALFPLTIRVGLRAVVTGALDQRAARGVAAFEAREIDGTAIAYVDHLRAELGGQQENDQCCGCPDHRMRSILFARGYSAPPAWKQASSK